MWACDSLGPLKDCRSRKSNSRCLARVQDCTISGPPMWHRIVSCLRDVGLMLGLMDVLEVVLV